MRSNLIGGRGRALGHPTVLLAALAEPTSGAAGSKALLGQPAPPPIEPGNGPQELALGPRCLLPPGTTSLAGVASAAPSSSLSLALMALVGLSAPAIMRRLREAAALPAPTPFVCALERPG